LSQKELAKDYLTQSRLRLETAKRVFEDEEAYAYCIRQSQEAVELALKSSLRLIGIDFPKWHDIGEVLIRENDKFPKEFKEKIQKLAWISEKLTALREPAMYGDESIDKAPSKLFKREDAKKIIEQAEFCFNSVKDLFALFQKSSKN
jgi:HEPN domain-containing protein